MERSVELEHALAAARDAAAILERHYAAGVEVKRKADRSPVTCADVEAEEAIRTRLRAAFPRDGFLGEESGAVDLDAERVWIVDPLDGTKSFVKRLPFFSTQIALFERGAPRLGVSSAPVFGEIAWADRGDGAFLDGAPVRVSATAKLADAFVSFGNVKSLAADPAKWARLGELVRGVDRVRGYGDFMHYHALAAGRLDAAIESDVSIYDVAALAAIVIEAGGTVTDLAGGPLTMSSTSIVATNGLLHAAVVELLAKSG